MQNAILHTVMYIFIVFNQTCSQKKKPRCSPRILQMFICSDWSLFDSSVPTASFSVVTVFYSNYFWRWKSYANEHQRLSYLYVEYFFYTLPPETGILYIHIYIYCSTCTSDQLRGIFNAIISSIMIRWLSISMTGLLVIFWHHLCTEVTYLAVSSLVGQYCC